MSALVRSLHCKTVLAGALLAIVVIVSAGCGSSGLADSTSAKDLTLQDLPATDRVSVRLGYFPNITHAPALVGVEQGMFTDELTKIGARLDAKTFNAGPEAVEAIFSGALDVAYMGPNPAVNAFQKSNGEALQIIAGSTSGGASFVVQNSINSAADLKGKVVASPQLGGTQDIALRSWLSGQGVTTDTSGGGDVAIRPQANADTLTTFKSGDIAGAWVPAPWDIRLLTEGGGKLLVEEPSLWPAGKFATTVVVVRTAFLNAHPAAVAAILRGHLASVTFIAFNTDEAQASSNRMIETVTGKKLPESLIAASWKSLTFTPDPLASTVKKSADQAVALGLNKRVDIAPLFRLGLVNALLSANGQSEVSGVGK